MVRSLDVDGSDSKMGKPAYRIGIVKSYALFVGIKITAPTSFGVLVDMEGNVLRKSECRLSDTSEHEIATVIAEQVRGLSRGQRVQGVGIGLGGRVHKGRVLASGMLGWTNVDLEAELEDALATTVTLSNDVRAFAQAESWWGAGRGKKSFVLISVGTGIGCCTVMDGTALEGEHGTAGMIGHIRVNDRGPRCESGHIGCVRAYASSTCLLRELKTSYGIEESFDEFVSQAKYGHEPEHRMAVDAVDAIADVVSNATAFIDPDAVVVSGDGVSMITAFEEDLRSVVDTYKHWYSTGVELLLQDMEFSQWARGAAAAAMERWTRNGLSQI